jgi:energy-coupling factor transport system substrate-specific component
MLVSNFMLGQGPYTPWQMAAWGLVGLLGAALGRITGRHLARVPLACACALAALIAKEIMNVYSWTVGASHTPAALLIEVGRGLPFDVTDTIATFLFAIAFGPELARLLARTRERMTVRYDDPSPGIAAAIALTAAVLALGASPRAASAATRTSSLSPEIRYLLSAQDPDGGFGSAPGQRSSELYTAWAAIALAAAGRDPATVRRDGHSVLDALRAEASTLEGPGDDERTILALHACGVSSYSLGRRNLLSELMRSRKPDGSFAGQVNLSAFAILALRAAGYRASYRPIADAAGWIERQQSPGGGFGFAAGGGSSDVDDTGAVIPALVATAGFPSSPAVNRMPNRPPGPSRD